MADDITLTVNVRNMATGEFQRLDRQLDRLRRSMRSAGSAGGSSSVQMQRLGSSLEDVQTRMQRLATTGQTTGRELTYMRQRLTQVNQGLQSAARAGTITRAEYTRLRAQLERTRETFDGLNSTVQLNRQRMDTTANSAHRLAMQQDRMRLAWVRSEQAAARLRMAEDRLRMTQSRLGSSTNSVGKNASFAGGAFSNLRQKGIGAAVVLGASLLPTIGALAPMIAGVGSVVGVAALAFSGLSAPTKFLTKDQKEFLEALKPVRKEFGNLRKAAQEAVLPKLTKSFGDVRQMVKALNPVIKTAGDTFGNLVGKIARGVSSKDFMGPFLKNVKMGTVWLEDFAKSFGTFSKAFFDFGTKSKPALDAWQDLLGGFLDRGLPSMFKAMESGIRGSSDFLRGLSAVINDGLLPGLGRLIGKFMEAFGPTLGKLLREGARTFNELATDIGDVFVALSPVGKFVGNLLTSFMDLGRIASGVFFDLIKIVGGGLLQTFTETFGGNELTSFKAGMESFSTWVQNNEGAIRGFFTDMAGAIIGMVNAGVQSMPELLTALKFFVEGALTSFDIFISGAAHAFGWIPGLGDKLKGANEKFDEFARGAIDSLDTAIGKSQEFADAFGPNSQRMQLRLNVDQAKAALEDIKTKLKDPELTKERKAKLTADKEEAERKVKEAEHALSAFDRKQAKAKVDADPAGFWNVFGQVKRAAVPKKSAAVTASPGSFWDVFNAVKRARIPKKSAAVGANPGGFWGTIRSIPQIVGHRTISVSAVVSATNKVKGWLSANGNIMRSYADGGMENHQAQIAPGGPIRVWAEKETGGEAYLPLGPSKRARSKRIAEQAVGVMGGNIQWFAKGGMSQATKDARSSLAGSFGISSLGRYAGYQRTPFERSLAVPGDVGSLVTNLNQAISSIRRAFSGKTESRLVSALNSSGRSLIRQQKNLDKVNKSLESAKTKLDDLKQSAAQLKDSVTSGVLSATNVTQVASGDGNVTMRDVMAQMRTSVDKSSAFSSALTQLKAKGVSKDIINQIAEAGISGGGLETAGAILSGSSSEIQTLNDMQAKINSAASSAGKTASDAMYAAGIKAADGLVKGLQKKQDAIEAAMLKIAKSMEKAIKRALGIKSPSKVMEKVGHFTAEGFAVGMKKNSSVDAAWSSMLPVSPTAGSSGGSGGGGVYTIPIYVGGKFLDEVVLDTNRRLVRTRGGDVQKVFGR